MDYKHFLISSEETSTCIRSAMYLFQNIALDCTSVPLMFRPTFHFFTSTFPFLRVHDEPRDFACSSCSLTTISIAWIWNFIPLQHYEMVKLRGIISLHWNLCTLESSRFLDSNETWSKHYTYLSLSSTLSQALPGSKTRHNILGITYVLTKTSKTNRSVSAVAK